MNKLKLNSLNSLNTKYLSGLPAFKSEKNKQYLAIGLTLIASIFFALFAINPTLSTISSLKKQIEDNTLVQRKLEQKISNLSSLSQQYQAVQEDESYITNAVPATPEITKLTAQVQSIAQASSVTIGDLKFSPVEFGVATSEGVLIFSMSASGPFSSLSNFLSTLTNMERLVSVETLELTQGVESSEITLKGAAYYKK